ncbi:hypothetical protein MKW92_040865 [Papaver armeniacum]|nr:hypothetical protein MKW92_040865 [Papaver armeniacum]
MVVVDNPRSSSSLLLLLSFSVAVVLSMSQWYTGGGGGGREGFKRLLFVAGSSGGGIFGGGAAGTNAWQPNNVGIAVAVTAMAGIALAATIVYSRRGHLRSPWSFRRRKHPLSNQQWKNLFDEDGKFSDGGVKFLKKVRSGGVDPSIRAEVWPFLLGVYDLSSTKEEREITRRQKSGDSESIVEDPDSPASKDVIAEESSSIVKESPDCEDSHEQVHDQSPTAYWDNNESGITSVDVSVSGTESSDSDSIEEPETGGSKVHRDEDFRHGRESFTAAEDQWGMDGLSTQAAVQWGLKDYDHLEPCRVFHAAPSCNTRPMHFDDEIDIAGMKEDYEAFWCFVGFMKKARHNFRLDVQRLPSYRHLEKMQAEDCFFVYRMVVVLSDESLRLSKQCGYQARIGSNSSWGRIRYKAPPTEDLLLYAIAACVLQRRKLIIEMYSSMDEIIRECNNMAGHLDVWKLLDDAHELVMNLHDKI